MADDFDFEEYDRWLEGQPKQVAVVLATRNALRVLPMNALLLYSEHPMLESLRGITLPQFRTVAACWNSGVGGVWDSFADTGDAACAAIKTALDEVGPADHSFPDGSGLQSAVLAAVWAADAAFGRGLIYAGSRLGPAIQSVSATGAFRSAAACDFGVYDASLIDRSEIIKGEKPESLAFQPLWWNLPNKKSVRYWGILKAELLHQAPHWSAWTDWYEDRLWGSERSRPVITKLEAARVLEPTDKQWKAGPDVINPLLLEIEARYRKSQVDPDEVPA